MIAKTFSAIPYGFDGRLIEVEGDMNRGLPAFYIVGMANKTINEAKERVKSAIINSNFVFPDKKVTINLAPADLSKDGSYLDLAIALTILILSGQLREQDIKNKLFVGELSLTGQLRPVKGIINIIECAKQAGVHEVFIPRANLSQATMIKDIKIYGVENLTSLFLHLKKIQSIEQFQTLAAQPPTGPSNNGPFLDHICGQELAKRAITIAIAGHHNILISGPPGAGKTLLAKTAANLLPPPTIEEKIAITKIHSLANQAISDNIDSRPFRSPHHTSSPISLIGGGQSAMPGEISLAHKGILFLDELPEFPRTVLEALRQPLEDKTITISRANQKTTYPADFMLIATMNPCPCGYYGDPTHECKCTEQQIQNYNKKLSGPLLDRIDINISVEKVKNTQLFCTEITDIKVHNVVKNTIEKAINRQFKRYGQNGQYNSLIETREIPKYMPMTPAANSILAKASEKLSLSARAYFKTIKVARTIADLDDSDLIKAEHIAEALSFRKR